jgi:hypothetical protein
VTSDPLDTRPFDISLFARLFLQNQSITFMDLPVDTVGTPQMDSSNMAGKNLEISLWGVRDGKPTKRLMGDTTSRNIPMVAVEALDFLSAAAWPREAAQEQKDL